MIYLWLIQIVCGIVLTDYNALAWVVVILAIIGAGIEYLKELR